MSRCTMTRPPIKKPMTAIREGICRLLSPLMAWPDVQPPAYRVPKPISKPPTSSSNMPGKEESRSIPKISAGKKSAPGSEKPYPLSAATVSGDRSITVSGVKNRIARKPPKILPKTKARFQYCFLVSILKKSANLPAPPIEHIVLRLLDMPNRSPKKSKLNMTRAIMGPATYHGHC